MSGCSCKLAPGPLAGGGCVTPPGAWSTPAPGEQLYCFCLAPTPVIAPSSPPRGEGQFIKYPRCLSERHPPGAPDALKPRPHSSRLRFCFGCPCRPRPPRVLLPRLAPRPEVVAAGGPLDLRSAGHVTPVMAASMAGGGAGVARCLLRGASRGLQLAPARGFCVAGERGGSSLR